MKQLLSLLLFCTLSFGSCGQIDTVEELNNNDITSSAVPATFKDEAKILALQAKDEYEKKRNFKKAIELFENAVKIDTEEEWMYVDMARVRLEIKDYEGAIKDLTKAIELKEKNDIAKTDDNDDNNE
jgi:tetratricopeptide (TPR) repeat protein